MFSGRENRPDLGIRAFFEAALEIGPKGLVILLVDKRESWIDKRERFCVSRSTKQPKQRQVQGRVIGFARVAGTL